MGGLLVSKLLLLVGHVLLLVFSPHLHVHLLLVEHVVVALAILLTTDLPGTSVVLILLLLLSGRLADICVSMTALINLVLVAHACRSVFKLGSCYLLTDELLLL